MVFQYVPNIWVQNLGGCKKVTLATNERTQPWDPGTSSGFQGLDEGTVLISSSRRGGEDQK